MRTEFLCISVLRVASGPRVKLVSCTSALNPTVVYSTDRSQNLCCFVVYSSWRFVLRLTLCNFALVFFNPLTLRLPRLGKRELILVFFVRLFDLCLFGLSVSSSSWFLGALMRLFTCVCLSKSEHTKAVPQTRSTALPAHQKKVRWGQNNDRRSVQIRYHIWSHRRTT